MKISMREIENRLEDFIVSRDGVFSLADAVNIFSASELSEEEQERLLNMVIEILTSEPGLFHDRLAENFVRRADFLRGGKFDLTPSAFEIKNGILFPGHRFAAYCSSQVFPSEIMFTEVGGAMCGWRNFKVALQEAISYHMLLGAEQMFDFLVADHGENAAVLERSQGASGNVLITVADLAEFYRRNNFEDGDALEVTIIDWARGEFEFRHVSGEKRSAREKTQWIERFSDSVEEVIETYGNYLEIPEQLAKAVYIGGEELLSRPAASIDEFYQQTDRIQIGYVSGVTVLVMKKDDTDEEDAKDWDVPEEVMISHGQTDSLVHILKEAGAMLQPIEIETFIMDQLYHDYRDFESFFQRCFAGDSLSFADEAQEAVFMNFIEDLWENRMEGYNRFEDDSKGAVRERLVELIEERVNWLRYVKDMEVAFDRLQDDDAFSRLVAGALHCNSLCELLNSEKHFVSSSEVDNIMESLEKIGDLQHTYIDELNRKIASIS